MYVYILGGRPKIYKYKTNKDSKYVDTGVLHIHEGGVVLFSLQSCDRYKILINLQSFIRHMYI